MTTIAEELSRQQARARKILEHALEIGPPAFLAALLRYELAQAEEATAAGDVILMIRSCKKLSEFKE